MERERMDEIIDNRKNGNLSEVRKLLAELTREEIHHFLVYMANDLNYNIDDILSITKFL